MTPNIVNAAVVFAYLAGTIGIGIYLSRFVKQDTDFFLAGRSLNKWVIAGMIMATNVAAIYLVGPAGAAYAGGGVSVLLIAWTGNMIAALSALIFVPRLRRLQITTVSELIETRYNVGLRLLVAGWWIIYYALFAGNAMYTLSTVLAPVLGLTQTQLIWFVSGAVILYCFFSGLMAAAYSSVIQSFLMILGGLILLPLCLNHPAVGGISGFAEQITPRAATFWKTGADVWPNYKSVIMFILLGLPYWCTSQYMLQCSFAGRSVRQASRGLILAAMITGVLTLSYIIPGICGRMIFADAPLSESDQILPRLLINVLPAGLGGLIIAALVAASNSTAAALLNAAATLSEHDFFRRFFPDRTARQYLAFGRAAVVVCGLLGVVFAFHVDGLGGIIKANFTIMSVFEPPIFVIVAGALLFRWATASGAIAAMIGGIAFGSVGWLCYGDVLSMEDRTFLAFPLCLAILVVASLVSRRIAPRTAEQADRVDEFLAKAGGKPPVFKAVSAKSGLALALLALVAFVWTALSEQSLPQPGNILIIMGIVLAFTFGCYLAAPAFVPDAKEGETEGLADLTGLRKWLASGWSWLTIGIVSLVMVIVLYLMR